MKRLLLSVALIFVACSKLSATEALIFNEGGYDIRIYIGDADKPVVGQVHFTSPGAKTFVVLPHEQLRVEKFDEKRRILLMHFSHGKDPDSPPSFTFSVKKNNAVLSIRGKRIKSSFDWLE
jgi:hypothetical protein